MNLNAADLRLIRRGTRARQHWELALLSGVAPAFGGADAGRVFGFAGSPLSFGSVLDFRGRLSKLAWGMRQALHALHPSIPGCPPRLARRLLMASAAATVTTLAVASTLAVKGYVEHPAEFWISRITERMVSPIYDPAGNLIGAVDTQGTMTREQAANLAYIPLHGDVPKTFGSGLLALENKHFYEGGIHNVCGIDLLSLLRPIVSFGRAGGSG